MKEKTFRKLNITRMLFVIIIMLASFAEIFYSLALTMIQNDVLTSFFTQAVNIIEQYYIIGFIYGVGLFAIQNVCGTFLNLTEPTLSIVAAALFLLVFILAFIRVVRVGHHLQKPLTYYKRNNVLTVLVTVLFFILLVVNAYYLLTHPSFGSDLNIYIALGVTALFLIAICFYFIVLSLARSSLKKLRKNAARNAANTQRAISVANAAASAPTEQELANQQTETQETLAAPAMQTQEMAQPQVQPAQAIQPQPTQQPIQQPAQPTQTTQAVQQQPIQPQQQPVQPQPTQIAQPQQQPVQQPTQVIQPQPVQQPIQQPAQPQPAQPTQPRPMPPRPLPPRPGTPPPPAQRPVPPRPMPPKK